MPKIVFSRTLEDTRWNTTVRREVDPAEMRALAGRSPAETWWWAAPDLAGHLPAGWT